MMNLAHALPTLLQRVSQPLQIMVGINFLTSEAVPAEEAALEFKTIAVQKPPGIAVDRAGLCKALMLKILAGLVRCGNLAQLRVEWQGNIEVNTDTGTASASLCVVGRPDFDCPEITNVREAIQASGVTDNGESEVWVPDAAPQPHRFVTPSQQWSADALYVSLMLELYSHGNPVELELAWRKAPKIAEFQARGKLLWSATAEAVIRKPKVIIVQ